MGGFLIENIKLLSLTLHTHTHTHTHTHNPDGEKGYKGECLMCKHEDLSSNPQQTHNKLGMK
jgi:hypothetical protein